MKRYVVIAFDIREHIVTGKVFEDLIEANKYLRYLNSKMIGKVLGQENRLLEYAELHIMDYVPLE